jgi:hypothetical protein
MKIVRASEISIYQFCHRAWWYQQQGYVPDNRADLAKGVEQHSKHGRAVAVNKSLRIVAYGFLFMAILLVIFGIIKTSL